MTTQNDVKAYTYLGFAEYYGQDYLYEGNDSPRCKGSVDNVISYLSYLADQIERRYEDGNSWAGHNGTWYCGSQAVARLEEEIEALSDGSHFSLNPTKEETEAANGEDQS